jgi:Xaa-Pro aminopeptidase
LTESLERGRLDALVATSFENVAYVTGIGPLTEVAPTQALGIFTRHGIALVVPVSHVSTLVAEPVDVDHIVCFGRADALPTEFASASRTQFLIAEPDVGPATGLAAALERLGVHGGAVGLDETGLPYDAWSRVADHMPDLKITPAAARLEEARRAKGPYEIECLGHALRITEEALDAVIQILDRGMTERDAADQFAVEVVRRGGWPRPPRVGIGEQSGIASPRPGDVALRPGNLVRFDVGCTYKGYCSRVGRTAVLGQPTPLQEGVYGAIQASLEAATAAVKSGATAGYVFDRAAAAFRTNDLPRFEREHVGQGIGLSLCERPELASGNGTALELGEVLYLEVAHIKRSSMGVRATDTVLVTSTGARVLNRSHHGLIVLD